MRSPTPPAAEPRASHLVQLVAQREIITRLRDRTFIISTIFLLVIVAASVLIPLAVTALQGRDTYTVATVGPAAGDLAESAATIGDQAFQAAQSQGGGGSGPFDAPVGVPDAKLTITPVPDAGAAEDALRDGSADVAVVPAPAGAAGGEGDVVLVAQDEVPSAVSDLLTRALAAQRLEQTLAGSTVSPAEVQEALAASAPAQRLLDPNAAERGLAVAAGVVFSLLFFLTVFSFGMSIAQSITEEKQSRIVELLVTAVPVRSLLVGKVLGNTSLALGQIVLLLAVGLAGAAIAGQGDLVAILLRSSGWFALFFVLGFLLLATLWAAAGSLASRQEDLQTTTLPMQILIMGPFFASVYIMEPGPWMTALSYVPLTSPLMMPRRIALGDAAWWEILASAGLLLATAAAFIAIGARVYSGSLLQTRNRVSWLSAWRRDG